MNRKQIEQNLILLGLSGSRAYGTFIEGQSDWEYKGVCIGPLSNYFGLTTFEQKDNGWTTESGDIPELNNKDNVVYEIKKYISLCQKQNPNLLELLWLDNHVFVSPIGQKLIDNRDLFLSKKVKGAYCGYSYSQLKRVETHRKWLLQPPVEKPKFISNELSKSELNAFLEFLYILLRDRVEWFEEEEELYELIKGRIDFKAILKNHPLPAPAISFAQEYTKGSGDFIKLLQETQKYKAEMKNWENYQHWLKTRNPERAALEARCGFDSKHGK